VIRPRPKQPSRRRIPHAELGADVAEQHGDDAADEERDPDRRARDRPGLAEQCENARADHRADAQDQRAANGQRAAPLGLRLGHDSGARRGRLHLSVLLPP
jgi:hypothetical protein